MTSDESMPAQQTDPLMGQLVGGRYRVHDVIGVGGMGVVYDAVHEELGRAVALKVLSAAWASDEGAIKRFQREARTSSNVGHDNIVDVYDLGRLDDGRPYLAMERLRGESLADLLDEHGRIDAQRVARFMRDAASALDAVHAKGLIHRDLKPENLVVVRTEEGGETVKLLDFGLAAFAIPSAENARLTRQGQVHGTPHYMAPEAGGNELPDRRADVYSLAVVAYEMLCGEVPFDSPNPLHILTQKMQRDAPYMSGRSGVPFPEKVEAVLAKALAREPDDRYPSAGELADALDQAIASMSSSTVRAVAEAPLPERAHASDTATSTSGVVASEPPSMPAHLDQPEAALPGRRRLWPWMVAAALLVGSALGSWYVLGEQGGDGAVASAEGGDTNAPSTRDDLELEAPPEGEADDEGPTADGDAPEGEPGSEQAAEASDEAGDEATDEGSAEPDRAARMRARRERERRARAGAASGTASKDDGSESRDEAAGSESSADDEEEGPDPRLAGESHARAKQLTDKGTNALVRGRLPDAIRHFRDATNAHRRYAPAWRGLGLANERLGRKPEARRAYERYLELAPGAGDAASVRERLDELGG